MAAQGSSTKQLKQTLGFGDLLSTAIGQIIGAGIMTLLGSAIALTGRSVPLAFLISAIVVVGYAIPKILICGAARVRGGEYTMVVMLCVALGVFAAFGAPHIQPDYLTNGFLTGGISGLLQAGGLLTFAVGGATVVANLSAEAKNPTRDIPIVILVATLIVAVIYGVVGIVAAGVLPVEQVAGENLAKVAEQVLPRPLYVFFIVCGAMFALISTLNAQFAWATKPILQGCDDGWLPQQLAYLHPKFKTPVILLGILYVLAVICIISGLSISILGNLTLIMTTLAVLIIGNVVLLVLSVIFTELRLKHVTVEPSFEELGSENN